MSSSSERVRAALELKEPDRVPVFDLMMEYSTVYSILGKKPDPLSLVLSNERAAKAFDMVVRMMSRSPVLTEAVNVRINEIEMSRFAHDAAEAALRMGYDSAWISYYPVFRLTGSKTMEDIFGRRYDVVIDRKGYIALPMYREGLIEDPYAWNALDKGPMLRLAEGANRVFASVLREYGDRLFVFGFALQGLFENTWQPMGFERFAVAVRRQRDFVERVIRFYEDLFCEVLEALGDAGVPGVIYSDDLAYRSGTMLSPAMLEDLFGDSYRRITGTAHRLGMKIAVHSCGNVTAILRWLADCGFDAVHPLEPTAGVELAEAKARVGDRMCLMGNIDVTRVLVDAGREEVFDAVKSAISDAGSGGGFILAPDHNHEDVSVERLRWMVEAAHRFGRYPL